MRQERIAVALGRTHAQIGIAERTGYRLAVALCAHLGVKYRNEFLYHYATERAKSLRRRVPHKRRPQ